MDEKNATKEYRRKIYERSLSELQTFLGSKGEQVKLIAQIISFGFLLASLVMAAYFGFLKAQIQVASATLKAVIKR